jgi:hypothetical protein
MSTGTEAQIVAVDCQHPLPQAGQRIRAHLKNGDILTGTVAAVWGSPGGTPCVNMWSHGASVQVFPGMGDTWEPADMSACNSGPGCSCNCEPKPGHGCKNANHCQVHSAGCHVAC